MSFNGNLYSKAKDVITSQGDLRRGDASGNAERLAIGGSGKVLQSNGTTESWETLTTADSVLTTQGDILYESASGLARLAQSTDGFVLTTNGAAANPVWASAGGGGYWEDLADVSATDAVSVSTATFSAKNWLSIEMSASGFDAGVRSDPNFQLNFQTDAKGDGNTRYSSQEKSVNDNFAARTSQSTWYTQVGYNVLDADSQFFATAIMNNYDVNTQLGFVQANVFDGTAATASPYGMISWGAYINEQITKITFSTTGDGADFGHWDNMHMRVAGHD